MKTLDLEKISVRLKNFVQERDWDQFHSVKNLSMALTVEASELQEIFQWMREEESNLVKNDPVVKSKVADEVADVFIYLLRIANKLEIDMEAAVSEKMKKNEAKYPKDKVRGLSKKYNEY